MIIKFKIFENFEKHAVLSARDEDMFKMHVYNYIRDCSGDYSYEIENFLNKLNVNAMSNDAYTPLMILFTSIRNDHYTEKVYKIFKLMINLGADPFIINKYDHDAYYYADPTKKRFFIETIPNFLEERELRINANKYNL